VIIIVNVCLLPRESLFEEMLQEKEEIAVKRKRCKEILRVLQQAAWVSSHQFLLNFYYVLSYVGSFAHVENGE
jgi:hypothetical protein